jgi:protein-S-isoprenylcysteine O-methyltransferase Ste14
MQDTVQPTPTKLTQLTAINIAKVITILLLLSFALIFGVHDFRQLLYLCLHVGYCVWWLLEQWLYPQRREQIFKESIDPVGLVLVILIVGIFYALPGYFAFTNPAPLSFVTAAIALFLYIFGSLINTSADVQKLTAKQYGATLVQDGAWRLSRNINYFGDLLRYLSFGVIAGSLWAYSVPALVALLYIQRIQQKEQTRSASYSGYVDYQQSSKRLIPFIW